MTTPKELYHIAGDAPDPAGTGKRGLASTIALSRSAIGHPRIYVDLGHEQRIITADVYLADGLLQVHLVCPSCSRPGRANGLSVKSPGKTIEYERHSRSPIANSLMAFGDAGEPCNCGCGSNFLGGRLNIPDRIACAWEVDPELRRQFGLATCKWAVVIENNIARRA